MSGGSMEYVYLHIKEAAELTEDETIAQLLMDLSEVLHDEEWADCCDISYEEYQDTLSKFKRKWLEQEPKTDRVKTELNGVKTELEPCEDCISNKSWSIKNVSKCLEKYGILIRQSECDLISRTDVLELISDINDTVFGQQVSEGVLKLPSIQPKTGHWIDEPNCWMRCSECGEHYPHVSIYEKKGFKYCPYCGARMEG